LKNDFIKINEGLRLFPNKTPETIDQIQRLKQAIIQLSSENQALETRVDVIQGKNGWDIECIRSETQSHY
jgi:hypothetical protein